MSASSLVHSRLDPAMSATPKADSSRGSKRLATSSSDRPRLAMLTHRSLRHGALSTAAWDNPAGMNPEPRPASRVLVVDRRDRLLLFDGIVPNRERTRLWCPPGGALKPDETFEEAALRELAEETAITDVALGPCVWRREHVFEMFGRWYAGDERFFLVRVGTAEVSGAGREAVEASLILGHRWWSAAEIAGSRETFVPRRLGELLLPLLRGEHPVEPFDVGI